MKINYTALSGHINKPYPIYIVCGEEWVIKQEIFKTIYSHAKKMQVKERIKISTHDQFVWENLYDYLYCNSLLAEKRLIEINLEENAAPKIVYTLLTEYADRTNYQNIVLINLGKLDAQTIKSKWYKALEAKSLVIMVWPLAQQQLSSWIIKKATEYQLKLTTSAIKLIIEWTEGNLIATQQTLEKIYLLNPSQPVSEDVIKDILNPDTKFSIFTWVDSLISGDINRSLSILQHLRDAHTEPSILIWMIAKELRLLSEIIAISNVQSVEKSFQQYRVFLQKQEIFRKFLSRFNKDKCYDLINHLSTIDEMVKGAIPYHAWQALELYCLRFK